MENHLKQSSTDQMKPNFDPKSLHSHALELSTIISLSIILGPLSVITKSVFLHYNNVMLIQSLCHIIVALTPSTLSFWSLSHLLSVNKASGIIVGMITIKKPSKTTFFLTPLQSLQYFGFTSPKVYINK